MKLNATLTVRHFPLGQLQALFDLCTEIGAEIKSSDILVEEGTGKVKKTAKKKARRTPMPSNTLLRLGNKTPKFRAHAVTTPAIVDAMKGANGSAVTRKHLTDYVIDKTGNSPNQVSGAISNLINKGYLRRA